MGHLIFKDILIIFTISIPIVILFRGLGLLPMLGFLVTGALIGPSGIGLIQDKQQIDILAELGVTLLLFSVGLEFSLSALTKMKYQTIGSGLLQIAMTIGAGLIIGHILGWTPYRGFYLGCLLSLSSTAIVLNVFYEHRLIDSLAGQVSTAILIMQDLALIPMMILLHVPGKVASMSSPWHHLLTDSTKAIFLIALVFLFTRFIADRLLRLISRTGSRELFVITVIVIALGMAWLTNWMELSFALGAFLGGLMIGGTAYKYQALSEISPFRHSFNSLFFVSIGMLLNFRFIGEHFLIVSLFILLIPLLKTVVTTFAVCLTGIPLRLALVTGLSLGQIGEFSFLLAYLGQKAGLIEPFFFQLIIAVAVILMMITPTMVCQAPRIADRISRLPLLRRIARESRDTLLKMKSSIMSNHVVICGFGPLGETFGKILKEHKIPYLVLELNPKTIERIRRDKENVFFGDGASEEILYHSGIDRARLLAITVPDYLNSAAIIQHARKINPNIRIITRSKYRNEVEKLYEAGADIVISEELEGGIEMGRSALREIGLSAQEVDTYIEKVRDFGSADFF